MEIVIDITEDVYTRLFDNGIQDNEVAADDVCEIARALRLGRPLPKGHGRLIDADVLMEYCQNDKSKVIDCNDIARFPTIIRREE